VFGRWTSWRAWPRQAPRLLLALLLAAAASDPGGELLALRAADLRVATVGYRVALANTDLCRERAPLTGLVLHSAGQYAGDYRRVAERLFGLREGIGVQGVVPGGPAERAGARADDRLIAVGGVPLASGGSQRGGSYADMAAAWTRIDGELAKGGLLTLLVERAGERTTIAITPRAGCASAIQLVPSRRMNATADDRLISLSTALVNYVADDDELATIVAHELAHNALGHRARVRAGERGVREVEREADYVGLYMMARAGYDIEASPRFWRRFGPEHGPGIFGLPDHPGWRKRERSIRVAVAEIRRKQSAGMPLVPGTARSER